MNEHIIKIYKLILKQDIKADLLYMSNITHRIHWASRKRLEFLNSNSVWDDPTAQEWIDSL